MLIAAQAPARSTSHQVTNYPLSLTQRLSVIGDAIPKAEPFCLLRRITGLRGESDVVRKQSRYDKLEVHLSCDLSAGARGAAQRKRRSGDALAENLSDSVILRLTGATAGRVGDSSVSRCCLNGMLQCGLGPKNSTELDNSEEHHQKRRH
jgi:hypothetical protein